MSDKPAPPPADLPQRPDPADVEDALRVTIPAAPYLPLSLGVLAAEVLHLRARIAELEAIEQRALDASTAPNQAVWQVAQQILGRRVS